jgi:hypothetical protein
MNYRNSSCSELGDSYEKLLQWFGYMKEMAKTVSTENRNLKKFKVRTQDYLEQDG